MFHHVQLACPPESETDLRAYYGGVLGMQEKPKPALLAVRGGCWFVDGYGSELHLGVEQDFRPARKAHPCLVRPDLDELAGRIEAAGYDIVWANPEETQGGSAGCGVSSIRRFHTHDCLGNRLEFMTLVPEVASEVTPAVEPA